MKYPHIPFILVFIFSCLPLLTGNWAVSVIPGWHTTIFSTPPPYVVLVWPWLLLVIILYRLFHRRQVVLPLRLYILHLLLAIALLIPVQYPQLLIPSTIWLPESAMSDALWLFMGPNLIGLAFALVQVAFVVYAFKTITRLPARNNDLSA